MNDPFLTFQKFDNQQDAFFLKEALEKENVEVVLEDVSASVDITFSGNTHDNQFLLKVRQSEFELANSVLENQAEANVDKFSPDHYLYSFSESELLEVIEKSDEWSKEDFLLAKRILQKKGHQMDADEIEEIKSRRLSELRRAERGKPFWIFAGYILAIAGGLLGMMIGWTHWKSTKLDPTGKRYHVYDEKTRSSGRTIFFLGCIFAVFWVVEEFF